MSTDDKENQDIVPVNDEEQTEELTKLLPMAAFTIYVMPSGDLVPHHQWATADTPGRRQALAKLYGQMLYYLNESRLKETIFRSLVTMATTNAVASIFIQEVIDEWGECAKREDETPVIGPMDVFKPREDQQ